MTTDERQCELAINDGLISALRAVAARLSCELKEIPLPERNHLHELLYKWQVDIRKNITVFQEKA